MRARSSSFGLQHASCAEYIADSANARAITEPFFSAAWQVTPLQSCIGKGEALTKSHTGVGREEKGHTLIIMCRSRQRERPLSVSGQSSSMLRDCAHVMLVVLHVDDIRPRRRLRTKLRANALIGNHFAGGVAASKGECGLLSCYRSTRRMSGSHERHLVNGLVEI